MDVGKMSNKMLRGCGSTLRINDKVFGTKNVSKVKLFGTGFVADIS